MNKDKIYIVGNSDLIGLHEAYKTAISNNVAIEIITPEQAREIDLGLRSQPKPISFLAPVYLENEFRPPLTRAQRRKQTRTEGK